MNGRGKIVGYKLCLPSAVFKTLKWSAIALPSVCCCTHSRNRSSVKHYVCWSYDFLRRRPFLSKDARKDNDFGDLVAKKLIDKIEELVKLLSNSLKMTSLHQYAG
jgi:hypothetical protein